MSNRKLVVYVISNKTSQKLVELLLYDEFFNNIKNLKLKILKLGLKIKNLGLGKYIPRQPNVKRLKYNELQYRDYIIINIISIIWGIGIAFMLRDLMKNGECIIIKIPSN